MRNWLGLLPPTPVVRRQSPLFKTPDSHHLVSFPAYTASPPSTTHPRMQHLPSADELCSPPQPTAHYSQDATRPPFRRLESPESPGAQGPAGVLRLTSELREPFSTCLVRAITSVPQVFTFSVRSPFTD